MSFLDNFKSSFSGSQWFNNPVVNFAKTSLSPALGLVESFSGSAGKALENVSQVPGKVVDSVSNIGGKIVDTGAGILNKFSDIITSPFTLILLAGGLFLLVMILRK